MAAVQETHFHDFIRRDVGSELCADSFPLRAAVAEPVFNDPLTKGLGDNGPSIINAEIFGDGRDVCRGGGRSDSVDHAVGKGDAVGDPPLQPGIASFMVS